MRTFRRLAMLLVLVVAATTTGSASVLADGGRHKIAVCHRTASTSNPYVFIRVSGHAKVQAHLSGQGKGHFATRVGLDFLPSTWQRKHSTCRERSLTHRHTTATILLCGDPKADITLRNRGDVTEKFIIKFTRARDGVRVRQVKYVGSNTTRTLSRKWVKGQTWVVVRNAGTTLARVKVTRRNISGPCPGRTV